MIVGEKVSDDYEQSANTIVGIYSMLYHIDNGEMTELYYGATGVDSRTVVIIERHNEIISSKNFLRLPKVGISKSLYER